MADDTRKWIKKITVPNGNGTLTYYFKDEGARELIAELQEKGLSFVISTNAANTPLGVTWVSGGTVITGTLQPSVSIHSIYLVPASTISGKDIYSEYICANIGTEALPSYAWEKLGDTDIDLSTLGALAYKNSVSLSKQTDVVLGEATTFTNSSSSVTFTGGSTDSFVKSYPGATSKLVTDTASKATAGTAVTVAKVASSATPISYVGNVSTTSVLENATVDETTETLTLGSVSVSQGSVTGTNGTQSITPYTFTNVTVATGSLSSNGSGDAVMTGLGTAVTSDAITALGTGTAAAQTISVGTNDKVTALTSATDVTVS